MKTTTPRKPDAWKARYGEILAALPDLYREAARDYPACALYLYFKPATATTWGAFKIKPSGCAHDGFELVQIERLNAIPYDFLIGRLRPIIDRLPIIAQNA